MPSKEEKEQAKAQGQAPDVSTDDTTAAERYEAPASYDAADYELKEVKDSPIPGHTEQVRKEG